MIPVSTVKFKQSATVLIRNDIFVVKGKILYY